jgi:hypothetical protein
LPLITDNPAHPTAFRVVVGALLLASPDDAERQGLKPRQSRRGWALQEEALRWPQVRRSPGRALLNVDLFEISETLAVRHPRSQPGPRDGDREQRCDLR